jgi:hypothetical protein
MECTVSTLIRKSVVVVLMDSHQSCHIAASTAAILLTIVATCSGPGLDISAIDCQHW